MGNLRYDPEFAKVIAALPRVPQPVFTDPLALRSVNDARLAAVTNKMFQTDNGVVETRFTVATENGASLKVYRFVPSVLAVADGPKPAVLYVHGGGLISGNIDPAFRPIVMDFAAQSHVTFFAVEYRLAPEHPYPTAVEDVYATIQWLQAESQSLGIDPARIGLLGASAGGAISAGTTLMARDRNLQPPLAKLILLYPMLDDRTTLAEGDELRKYLTWTAESNSLGWGAYLGSAKGGEKVSQYAAPARAARVDGFPRTYIDIAGLDLLKDEALAFALRLTAANVQVEMHLYPGVPHGFDGMGKDTTVGKQAMVNRVRAIADI